MTDTTAARRQLLALLLDRVEYGNLLEPEKPLLRALVAAEQGAADAATTPDDDARPWIANAFGLDIESSWGVIADAARTHLHHLATANDTLDRVRALHTRTTVQTTVGPKEACSHCESDSMSYPWPCDTIVALDGPSATPDDAQATADRAALNNAIAELPELASDRAVYGDRTGQMLGVLAGSQAPGTLARCSPLVNADCPGHTGPPYCDRAPSNPITPAVTPVWVPDDSRPCPTQFADGDCAGTWMHPGDCTTNADDIPSTQETDAPSEPQP